MFSSSFPWARLERGKLEGSYPETRTPLTEISGIKTEKGRKKPLLFLQRRRAPKVMRRQRHPESSWAPRGGLRQPPASPRAEIPPQGSAAPSGSPQERGAPSASRPAAPSPARAQPQPLSAPLPRPRPLPAPSPAPAALPLAARPLALLLTAPRLAIGRRSRRSAREKGRGAAGGLAALGAAAPPGAPPRGWARPLPAWPAAACIGGR